MDFLTAILDFLNVTDNSHYIKKDIEKLSDKNEYLGSRILSFLSLLLTLIAILFFICLLYLIIKQKI
jgi:hypothetical protein